MNQFSKLSRDEMRKITGGEPPVYVCNVGMVCIQGTGVEGTMITNGTCTDVSTAAVPNGCACISELGAVTPGWQDCLILQEEY